MVAFAVGVALGGSAAFAADLSHLNDAGAVTGRETAASSAKPGPTKLTLGLATLSAEFQTYQQAVARGTASPGTFVPKKTKARLIGETVVIDAVAADDPEILKAELEALGAEVTAVAGRMVSARLPLARIPDLEALESLKFARPALAITRTGDVTR